MKIVKLTLEENPNVSFLACSWHGAYTGQKKKDAERKDYQDLQTFLKEVSKAHQNIPYVVGGDFNFNTIGANEREENLNPVQEGNLLCGYDITPRAESKSKSYTPYKDNFLCKYPELKLEWIQVLPFINNQNQNQSCISEEEKGELSGVNTSLNDTRGTIEDLLDHDPLIAVLTFTTNNDAEKEESKVEQRDVNKLADSVKQQLSFKDC